MKCIFVQLGGCYLVRTICTNPPCQICRFCRLFRILCFKASESEEFAESSTSVFYSALSTHDSTLSCRRHRRRQKIPAVTAVSISLHSLKRPVSTLKSTVIWQTWRQPPSPKVPKNRQICTVKLKKMKKFVQIQEII